MPHPDQPVGTVSANQLSPTPIQPVIAIDPSKLKAQATSLLVLVSFSVTFCSALAGFLAKRDLAGFILFMQRDETLTGLSAVVAFALLIWRQVATRKRIDTTTALAMTSPVGTLTKPVAIVEGSIVDQAVKAAPLELTDPVVAVGEDYAVPAPPEPAVTQALDRPVEQRPEAVPVGQRADTPVIS